LDCTILQLGLHILLFGLHEIGWTAPLEYALEYGPREMTNPQIVCVVRELTMQSQMDWS